MTEKTSRLCHGKVGDIVYSIPTKGSVPVEHLLIYGDRKMIMAINSNGEQEDFNPEKFVKTLVLANARAVENELEFLAQQIQESVVRMLKYKGAQQ